MYVIVCERESACVCVSVCVCKGALLCACASIFPQINHSRFYPHKTLLGIHNVPCCEFYEATDKFCVCSLQTIFIYKYTHTYIY